MISQVYAAIEAVEGVAAVSGYVVLRANEFSLDRANNRIVLEETTGTPIRRHRSRRGRKTTGVTIQMYDHYDMGVYLLAAMFGAPTVTAVAGATGAFDHMFKAGGTAQKPLTLKAARQVAGGQEWWQIVGFRGRTFTRTEDSEGVPMIRVEGSAKNATKISAPSVVTDTTASYIHPDLATRTLTLGGGAWDNPQGIEVKVENGLDPAWSLNSTQLPGRRRLGTTVATATIPASYYDAYVGSLNEEMDSDDGLLSAIVLTHTDPTNTIGTGTPVPPRVVMSIPKATVDSAGWSGDDKDADETAELGLNYDATLASNISFTYRNLLTSSIYTGS